MNTPYAAGRCPAKESLCLRPTTAGQVRPDMDAAPVEWTPLEVSAFNLVIDASKISKCKYMFLTTIGVCSLYRSRPVLQGSTNLNREIERDARCVCITLLGYIKNSML